MNTTMTAKDWLDVLVQVALLIGALSAGYWGLRRWVQRAAADAKEARAQLQTSNGTTVAGYVEAAARDISSMRTAIDTLTTRAGENRELATSALTLARHVSDRLDAHLAGHDKPS